MKCCLQNCFSSLLVGVCGSRPHRSHYKSTSLLCCCHISPGHRCLAFIFRLLSFSCHAVFCMFLPSGVLPASTMPFTYLLILCVTGCYCAVQADFKVTIPLPGAPECWDYGCVHMVSGNIHPSTQLSGNLTHLPDY